MHIERLGVDESVSAVFPPEQLVEKLSDSPFEVEPVDTSGEAGADYQAVVTFEYRESYLDLDWIHSIQAGVDRFPVDRLRDAGVVLTNSTGIHADAIGETVAGFVLSLARRLHVYERNQTRREWSKPDWDEAWTVAGEQACVVGLGTLGRGIVDRLSGLDLELVGVRRDPKPEPRVRTVYPTDQLHEAVSDARFVVLSVPLTDSTEGMVDADVFDAMRDDAYLVNVARGGVVDTEALLYALRWNDVGGAVLDVTDPEPLPPEHPLWDFENVLITPHNAGYTPEYYERLADIVAENVDRARETGAWTGLRNQIVS
jgi:D-2-hydroxyacid dehydrogenase (NADP+)